MIHGEKAVYGTTRGRSRHIGHDLLSRPASAEPGLRTPTVSHGRHQLCLQFPANLGVVSSSQTAATPRADAKELAALKLLANDEGDETRVLEIAEIACPQAAGAGAETELMRRYQLRAADVRILSRSPRKAGSRLPDT